ncbi:MAG: hypothetical protein ACKO2P_08850 [Planctomycetota bacterium]
MPEFRYQARHFTGEPVFGMRESSTAEGLVQQLQSEGLLDVHLVPLLSVSELFPAARSLPRLVQLRVGERLREALLLHLPAHETVRAVADEPFLHPLLMVWPWLTMCSLFFSLICLLLTRVIPVFAAPVFPVSLACCVLMLLCGYLLQRRLQHRPRQLLRQLSEELERGQSNVEGLRPYLPGELRGLEFGGLDERRKTQLLAELVPALGRLRLQRYRLATALLGPLPVGLLFTGGLAIIAATIVRQIMQVIGAFGVTFFISNADSWLFGISLAAFSVLLGGLVVVGLNLLTGRCEGLAGRIPFVGRSLVWLSQATFCRVLAAYLRQEGAAGSMVRSAAAVTGGRGIRGDAADVAAVLDAGRSAPEVAGRWLNGVPLVLLTRSDGGPLSEADSRQMSESFDGMAGAFEAAARGDAGFAGLIFSMVIVVFSGLLLAATWLIVLMPLVRMLGDLSWIAPRLECWTAGGLWS